MSLRLLQYADASPGAGWLRDGKSYVVLSRNVAVGAILHNQVTAGREWWAWHVSVIGNAGYPHGTEPTREDAMRAFASAWSAWLAEAGLVEVEPAPPDAGTPHSSE